MGAQKTMDSRAKLAVGLLAAIVLLIIVVALRGIAQMMTPVSVVAQGDSGDNQIITIGGQTEYLSSKTFAGKIADWLNTGKARTQAFTLGERNFQPASDVPTPDGWDRLKRFVGLMESNPEVTARVYVIAYEGVDASARQTLAQKRAERVRSEVLSRGIDPSRVTSSADLPAAHAVSPGAKPTMVIVLSK